MRGRGAAWVLALVLLAGCAPAPAAEPPEEPEVRVRTHWEALETRAGSLPDVETPWPGGIGEAIGQAKGQAAVGVWHGQTFEFRQRDALHHGVALAGALGKIVLHILAA